jgi:predicted ATPase
MREAGGGAGRSGERAVPSGVYALLPSVYTSAPPVMKITRLRAQNFKSFDTVDVELGDLNVLIGANASGKSNFLSILTFLRDIARDGLEDAVSMQGDVEYLRNVQLERSDTHLEFRGDNGLDDPGMPTEEGWVTIQESGVNVTGVTYSLTVGYSNDHFEVVHEEAGVGGYFQEKDQNPYFDTTRQDRKESTGILGEISNGDRVSQTSFLSTGFEKRQFTTALIDWIVSDFRVYELAARELKSAGSPKGKARLEEDGSNVALVLQNLLQDDEKRRKFLNLARVLLPFVEDLEVERFAGQSLLMRLQESHTGDAYIPASLLSGGTVKIVALLIALYFGNESIMAFEEPTTSLHPKLISQLMQMMREVSEERQVFITTHNPEVIRHVDLDDVYLVSRDADGFSQISKPADKTEVRTFLENDLGIDDLFVQNLL